MGLARSFLIGYSSDSYRIGIFGVRMTQCVGAEAYKYPRVTRKGLSIPVTFASVGSSPSDCACREGSLSCILACVGDVGGLHRCYRGRVGVYCTVQ